jgi:hypothetical protein
MIMKKLVIMLCMMTSVVTAQELKRDEFGLGIGYLFAGDLWVGYPANRYYSFGESYLLRLEWAHYFEAMSKRFGVGLYVNTASPYYGSFETISMSEIGMVLKGRFNVSERVQIKPGAYVGYRSYGSGAGDGLGVNANVQVQYQMGKMKPFIELGFLTQPAGGNKTAEATFSPVFQTSVGLAF